MPLHEPSRVRSALALLDLLMGATIICGIDLVLPVLGVPGCGQPLCVFRRGCGVEG